MLQKAIEDKLAQYIDPYLEKDLFSAKAIKRLAVDDKLIQVDLVLGYPCQSGQAAAVAALSALLAPVAGGRTVEINCVSRIESHAGQQGIPGLSNVKNIIAVGSGKGGVGKSTVAVNLALALVKDGAKVGMLDADIYGPSQPAMLGTMGQKPTLAGRMLQPIQRHGLQSMSIGYLIDEQAPMVWRGPMIGKALQQLLHDTHWDALDYLIIDLPPGTGDIQLTLCQKIPVSGAIVVTTPQDLALLDVRRACEMFHKLNVPILGVIENMSVYHCSNCGHEEHLFGRDGGEKLAKQYDIPLLGRVPLDKLIREMTDSGEPPLTQAANSHTDLFVTAARKATAKLSLQPKDYSHKFPKVVVE